MFREHRGRANLLANGQICLRVAPQNDGASSDTFIVPRNSDLDHSVRST
jgi:hypothetical protein